MLFFYLFWAVLMTSMTIAQMVRLYEKKDNLARRIVALLITVSVSAAAIQDCLTKLMK